MFYVWARNIFAYHLFINDRIILKQSKSGVIMIRINCFILTIITLAYYLTRTIWYATKGASEVNDKITSKLIGATDGIDCGWTVNDSSVLISVIGFFEYLHLIHLYYELGSEPCGLIPIHKISEKVPIGYSNMDEVRKQISSHLSIPDTFISRSKNLFKYYKIYFWIYNDMNKITKNISIQPIDFIK
jgi:hypothetical protein